MVSGRTVLLIGRAHMRPVGLSDKRQENQGERGAGVNKNVEICGSCCDDGVRGFSSQYKVRCTK